MLKDCLKAWVFVVLIFGPASAEDSASTFSIPFAGSEYSLDARFSTEDNSAGKLAMRAELRVQPIIDDLNGVIERLGLNWPPGIDRFQSFTHEGTGGEVRGSELWIKYHFQVDPHNSPQTRGSVEVWFAPHVADNSVSLRVSRTQINISNDVVRTVLGSLGIADRLEVEFADAVNTALADNSIMLPSFIADFGWELIGSEFIVDGGAGWLRVNALMQ